MFRHPFRLALAAATLTAGLAGTAMAQPRPYAPIPEPRVERIPPPPRHGPRMVWEPGHWHWNGHAYMWNAGRYVGYRANHGEYEPGRWEERRGHWVWMPAHWR